jgi:hypothetical protein
MPQTFLIHALTIISRKRLLPNWPGQAVSPTDDVLYNALLFSWLKNTDFGGFGQPYRLRMEETVIQICAFSKC